MRRGRRPPGAKSHASTARARARVPADHFDAWLEAKARRKSPSDLPRVVARAVRLVLRADRRTFLLVSALQLLAAAMLGAQLAVGKVAIDAVLATQDEGRALGGVVVPLLGLALVTAVLGLVTALAGQAQRLVNERVLKAAWDEVLDVTSSVPLATYEHPDFFEDLHRVQLAAIQKPLEVARGLVELLSGAAGVVVLTIVLVRIEPLLPLVLVLSGPPLWLVTRRKSRYEYEFVRDQATVYRERNYLRGALTLRDLAKEVRAFDLAPTLRGRYAARYDRYLDGLRTLVGRQLRLAVGAAVISSVVLAITLLLLVYLITSGRVSLAEAAVAAVSVRLLSGRVTVLLNGVGQLYESSLFLQDLQGFTERKPAAAAAARSEAPALSRLAVEDVTMTYPAGTRPALQNVDIEIGAGEVVALVGENGSGKTTLAKLVAQLYRPDTGRITWNGEDSADLDARALRRQIAVIFQDYAQWELTAHDNIALGRPERTDDRDGVLDAARRAGAAEFLERLPLGMDTLLSTSYVGGSQLSIGQWQRVALARALYRDASLVVLDEPSSALDPRAESELFTRLREIVGGRSVLFISHRFSTVRSADRIYVMRAGEIVERGDHESLMAQDGAYAELFRLQAAAYLDGRAPAEG